jgi:4-aminobutyrate aminotransferase-like enzyme/Ser/Thr protein kinase RdoA (MazF antagonist)
VTTTNTADRWLKLAAERYGLTGVAILLPGYIDQNIRITTDDGASFVLRVTQPPADAARLTFIDSVLAAASSTSFSTPRLVPTTNGEHHVSTEDGHIMRVFTWLEGTTLEDVGLVDGLAFSIGQAAAEMVTSLAHVHDPTTTPLQVWDLRHANQTITQRFSHLEGDLERHLITVVLGRYRTLNTDALPLQVVHNDINPGNLLVDRDRVTGLLDFGDTTRTFRIAELAIAAAYAALDTDNPLQTIVEVCGGYHAYMEHTDLAPTADEAAALPDLILARLATSVTVAAARSDANPHWHATRDATWDLLTRLVSGDIGTIASTITAAALNEATPPAAPATRPHVGTALSLAYDEPLNIASGRGTYLADHLGRRYLDAVNNVAHVGHSHPAVVRAASVAAATLNTNTRYLHPELIRYAERLAATLPAHLDTVFLVNSGSEANELAVRLARTATGRNAIACVDHGYHGNTSTLIDISPYKFNGPGGQGRRSWVTVLPALDPYRNTAFGGDDAYREYQLAAADVMAGTDLAALIVEALPGCGGQIVPSGGSLSAAYDMARSAGAVVIADEVQTGLGRVGDYFWAFELFDVVPDIVTIGKPAGNGHPLAAVVTTRSIADAFDNGMEYFNTFGGNPVSAAVGNAVLDVIEDENLQQNAATVGHRIKDGLASLADTHVSIGDVRGVGLFIGVDLVTDRATKEPDASLAHIVVERAKLRGVLLSTDGPGDNVIKIKPPLVFSDGDADRLVTTIDHALQDAP